MAAALTEGRLAVGHEDVPVGAVVVDEAGELLAAAHNERELRGDPTAHAEMLAMRAAAVSRGGGWRLTGCTVVVTLEPCVMCAGAMIAARVARCVFAAWDDKAGACGSVWDLPRDPASLHRVEIIGGVEAEAGAGLLADFFRATR